MDEQLTVFVGIDVSNLGAMAVFLVPNLLPLGAAEYVASRILGEGAWQAGIRLMEFESPLRLSQLVTADRLMRANATAIEACRAMVARTGKDQPCTITVPVSGR